MDGEVDENAILDYAIFHVLPTQNSYEAVAYGKGEMERVANGHLDQLAFCLLEAKGCQFNQPDTSFKLQLAESEKGLSWFTRGTLAKFLHIVNTPEALKDSYAILGEMAQLEETKKFHISLYAKDQDQSSGREADVNGLKDVGHNQQLKVETVSSDATKNELLRALDLRLMTLEEELVTSFDRAAGANCSTQQISDISAFIEHFGSADLRNLVSKLLSRTSKNIPSESTSFQNMRKNTDNSASKALSKPLNTLVSPAKIAQVERQSSSESDDSSESNDEDQSCSERSRSMVRSATPRRSASPMRRIQIGRSGSRRSTPITIKSLSYFPARERTSFVRDNADESNSANEEEDGKQTKKPENAVRRMSVQDAISLFENKQKDQKPDVQKISVSGTTTAKSVLRRWSAGMGDSFTQLSHVNASNDDVAPQKTTKETSKLEEVNNQSSGTDDNLQADNTTIETKGEEVNERVIAPTEWNRQKEAELNQMLLKMMESKPVKKQVNSTNSCLQQDATNEERGDFHSQYREKRDEKLRAENLSKRAVKEAQFKVMKETLELSKAKMASKNVRAMGKGESTTLSQKPRRNSSPPILPKKEVLKPTNTKKASPKATPLPATRKSWSPGPLPKKSGNTTPKTSGVFSTNSTTINRRTPISTSSPTQPNLSKVKKGTPPDVKLNLRSQQENKQRSTSKSTKSLNTKRPSKPADDSSNMATKPSFYNKVTKKSSVVPLESKPFLKKGTGLSPRPKPKVSQPDDSVTNSGHIIQPEVNELVTPLKEVEAEIAQPANKDTILQVPLNNIDINNDDSTEDTDNKNAVELPTLEIPEDDDVGISSPAWVEVNNQVESASCEINLPSLTMSPEITSETVLSNPKVRHSLSQMLQADNNDSEIIEWGNAENPPALVYQKDAPKGFKRLLKFARKSKGDLSGFSSPSVFSEGEDDREESKANSKRSSDLLRKAALQAKGYEPPKSLLTGSIDGRNSSKGSTDYPGANDNLTAQSSTGTATILDRLRDGQNSLKGATNQVKQSFGSA